MTTFKDRLDELWVERQIQDEEFKTEEKARQGKKTLEYFRRMFNCEPERVDGTSAFIEGLHLRFWDGFDDYRSYEQSALIETCKDCGQEFSTEFHDPTSLGRLVAQGVKHDWTCPKANRPVINQLSAADELVNAIHRIIEEAK